MAIPLTDVAWQHRQVRAEIDQALDRILTDVHADGAEFIAALEATMERRLGDGIHVIGVEVGEEGPRLGGAIRRQVLRPSVRDRLVTKLDLHGHRTSPAEGHPVPHAIAAPGEVGIGRRPAEHLNLT